MTRISMTLLGTVVLAINAVAQPKDRDPGNNQNHEAPACKEAFDCGLGKWPDPTIEACAAALARPCSHIFPQWAIFLYRAKAYFAKNEYKLALADFGESIRLMNLENFENKPGVLADAFSKRSWIYFMTREYDSALTNIDEAIRLNSAHSYYYLWRATVYVRGKRDYDSALADLDVIDHRSTQDRFRDSNLGHALILRGEVYAIHKRDYDRAIADLDQVLHHTPDATAHTLRGLAYMAKGDAERARADFDAAEQINPNQKKATEQRWQLFSDP